MTKTVGRGRETSGSALAAVSSQFSRNSWSCSADGPPTVALLPSLHLPRHVYHRQRKSGKSTFASMPRFCAETVAPFSTTAEVSGTVGGTLRPQLDIDNKPPGLWPVPQFGAKGGQGCG